MKDQSKAKQVLIQELVSLRQKIAELEQSESERKRAEEAHRKSEALYRDLVETSQDLIWECDVDGRYTYLNPAWEQIFGYKVEEMLGKRFTDFQTPEYAKRGLKEFARLLQGNTVKGLETLHIGKDDREIHLVFNAKFLVDEKGNPAGTLGTAYDITERRRMEEALRDKEQRLSSIYNTVGDVIFYLEVDTEGQYRFVSVNPSFCRVTGLSQEQIVGKTVTEVIPEPSLTMVLGKYRQAIEARIIVRWEEVSEYPTGRLTGEVSVAPVFDDKGKCTHLVGSVHDITQRKLAEKAREESEKRYRELFENASLGIFQSTRDGKVLTVNQMFARMFGYESPQEVCSAVKNISTDIFADPQRREEIIRLRSENPDLDEFENLYCRKDGSTFLGKLHVRSVLDSGGNMLYFEGFIENIAERKKAEKQLQDTLDSLRRAVGTTIQVMVSAVETRDPYTSGHQIRSADLARAIAMEMELPQDKIDAIRMAGSIHDIGKLSIPAEILSKPTKLSEIEFSLIKEHARKGYEMLKDVESPWPLAEIVHQHHERMDGSGYPRNLKGDDTLIEARILAVADVVEAMASHRPYRPGLGIDAALNEIEKNRGTIYDKTVADACLKLFREKGFQLEKT